MGDVLRASYVHGASQEPLKGLTVGECLDAAALHHADHEALVVPHQNVRWTYSELKDRVNAWAAGFVALGLQPGDRVGLWAPNLWQWVVVQFATAKVGLILVNINPAYRKPELEYALKTAGCRALIVAPAFKSSNYVEMLCELMPEIASAPPGELISATLPGLQWLVTLGCEANPGFVRFDDIPDEQHEVIIAGFGRVGQIVGRMLQSIDKPFTALEIDSSQVDIVRRYGNSVHFGDAARPEVLRAAGANKAKILVLATADMETSLHIAETAKRQFPNLTIVARAHNRRHAHKLMDVGVDRIFRDTLLSSLAMGESVLEKLGLGDRDIRHISDTFRDADEKLLLEQHALQDSEDKLIQSAKDAAAELESIFEQDLRHQG